MLNNAIILSIKRRGIKSVTFGDFLDNSLGFRFCGGNFLGGGLRSSGSNLGHHTAHRSRVRTEFLFGLLFQSLLRFFFPIVGEDAIQQREDGVTRCARHNVESEHVRGDEGLHGLARRALRSICVLRAYYSWAGEGDCGRRAVTVSALGARVRGCEGSGACTEGMAREDKAEPLFQIGGNV